LVGFRTEDTECGGGDFTIQKEEQERKRGWGGGKKRNNSPKRKREPQLAVWETQRGGKKLFFSGEDSKIQWEGKKKKKRFKQESAK